MRTQCVQWEEGAKKGQKSAYIIMFPKAVVCLAYYGIIMFQVNVDLISFGEVETNAEMLTKFIETVNGRDGSGSNLVAIPPGPHLSDALVSSPILAR